jgi:hypothetical protein
VRHRSSFTLYISIFLVLIAGWEQSPRMVLAFYYTWYSSTQWDAGKACDVAAQPYNSTDPAAIA